MRVLNCDYLVVGSGMAGLSVARHLAPYGKVLVVTKRERSESNTNYAQGGIACVTLEDDTFEMHVADTLVAGAGLGGVIALALGARGYACVALDPFLSTAKQWPIAVGLGRSAERGAAPHPDLLFDALGWREGQKLSVKRIKGGFEVRDWRKK